MSLAKQFLSRYTVNNKEVRKLKKKIDITKKKDTKNQLTVKIKRNTPNKNIRRCRIEQV